MRWTLLTLLALLPVTATADDYTQQILAWREKRLANLKKPDGWLTLAGLFWLESGPNRFGSALDNNLRFPQGPEHLGRLDWDPQNRHLHLLSEAGVLVAGQRQHELEINPDEPEATTVMSWDSLSWYVIRRDDRLGVRLKDSQSPILRSFQGLDYFPIDPQWRVEGRFEAYSSPKELREASIVPGLAEVSHSPGELVFNLGERSYRLVAQADGADEPFFVVFGDRSNGHGSYGGGRFLVVERPDSQGRIWLDFNRAYNPPCIFTPYATCPLPSRRNRLDFEVTAGEKFAGH